MQARYVKVCWYITLRYQNVEVLSRVLTATNTVPDPTATSLVEMGESMKQIADIKYNLDDNMKMNFLEPLHTLSTKDIKEVQVR